MRKYIFFATVILALFLLSASAFVFGAEEKQKNDNEIIQEIVNNIDGVCDSRVFAYGDCVLIAVRTKGVYLKSFENELANIAKAKIQEKLPNYTNIKLTTSLKIFRALEYLSDLLKNGKVFDELDLTDFDFEYPNINT